jgi:hypothetical protein
MLMRCVGNARLSTGILVADLGAVDFPIVRSVAIVYNCSYRTILSGEAVTLS